VTEKTLDDIVRGELDRDSVPELASRLKEVLAADSPCRTLVLDLGGLHFMDVGGMRLLLDAHEHAARSGVALLIVGCPPRVLRVLRITRTADLLPLVPLGRRSASETQ
jgi:anti-anti-sigma factor